MNYLFIIGLLGLSVVALRRAGYRWSGAVAGGVVATALLSICGVLLPTLAGIEHPSIGVFAGTTLLCLAVLLHR